MKNYISLLCIYNFYTGRRKKKLLRHARAFSRVKQKKTRPIDIGTSFNEVHDIQIVIH